MLILYRLRSGSEVRVDAWKDAKDAELGGADLSGAVELAHAGRIVRFGSQWVRSLRITAATKQIRVDLAIEPPLSDFPLGYKPKPWKLTLDYDAASHDWRVAAKIPWLIHEDFGDARLNQWLKQGNNGLLKLRDSFPFDQLGLSKEPIEKFDRVRVGLFTSGDEVRTTLAVVCVAEQETSTIAKGEFALAHLAGAHLHLVNTTLRGGLVANLHAGTALRDGLVSPWLSFFQWPVGDDSLYPDRLFGQVWNPLANAAAVGRRGSNAGRPWWPIAHIAASKSDHHQRWQRLVFAPSEIPGRWRVIKFEYGARTGATSQLAPAVATFNWYVDETHSQNPGTVGNTQRVLKLSGDFKLLEEPAPPDSKDPKAGVEAARYIEDVLHKPDDQAICTWTFKVSELVAPIPEWLGFGSVDIKPTQPDGKDDAHITLRLVGSWRADHCDLFQQLDVDGLPCEFRMSNSTDPLPQTLVAQFDVANRLEDELQRPTRPVVASLGGTEPGSIAGKLGVKMRAEPERDAIIQLQLTRNSLSSSGDGQSLYVQTRPFNFARLWPTNFDEEAGLDFGYWRSDDPEGPQWRLPDATVEFDLPPQSVAEEMERGQRFWPANANASYIEAERPIKFRFAPPTHVKVRPGWVDRRYHRNANNLSDVLDGARVEAFDTELLYPIRLEFAIDGDRNPVIDIAESGTFVGRPPTNLPVRAPDNKGATEFPKACALVRDIFPDDIAEWFVSEITSPVVEDFAKSYDDLRWQSSANRAQFVARIAQFHVYDPYLPDRQLMLSQGLKAGFRKPEAGNPPGSMPPIMNPLPTGAEIEPTQKDQIKDFLDSNKDWGKPVKHGALRAGAIHTMEFPSEFLAVLRKPGAVSAFIETLSFSTLGASGSSAASFDKGLTTFSVEIADGQVWRIRKIRLGRIALLWNKAKHVVVYERSVVPSLQFASQQSDKSSLGWPILRKMEEYVEPLEMIRIFSEESEPELGSPGFAHSSEFITPRIYVDGAWGRDLRHGYEIPLWNPADTSRFYPKPLAAINAHTGTGEYSKAWHEHPEELYFYTNTEEATAADSNTWQAFYGVDLTDAGPSRFENCTNAELKAPAVLDSERLPSPRTAALRRKRFDLLVRTDGPVNLQHGRGETQMLAAGIEVLSLARTAATSPTPVTGDSPVAKAVKEVQKLGNYGAKVDLLRDEAEAFLRELPALYIKFQFASCKSLTDELKARTTKLFERVQAAAKNAFPAAPDLGVETKVDEFVARMRAETFEWALPLLPSFTPIIEEFREQLAHAKRNVAGTYDDLQRIRERLDTVFETFGQCVDAAENKLKTGLVAPIAAAANAVNGLAIDADKLAVDVNAWLLLTAADIRAKAEDIRKQADAVAAKAQSVNAPYLAPVLRRIESTVRLVSELAREVHGTATDGDIDKVIVAIKAETHGLMGSLQALVGSVRRFAEEITDANLESAREGVRQVRKKVETRLAQEWQTVDEAKAALDAVLVLIDEGFAGYAGTIESQLDVWRKGVIGQIDKTAIAAGQALHQLTTPAVQLNAKLRATVLGLQGHAAAEIRTVEGKVQKIIQRLEQECEQKREELLQELHTVSDELVTQVKARVTDLINTAVDDETVQRIAGWRRELGEYKDTVGKGIKLVKAIGNLPELPQLKFNADRVEYVFDDLKKQIATSPFAARMREIDSGLKELGIAIPVRELFDQLVPEKAQLDFNKVFRDFGGIDFRKLFGRFRIPELDKENVKVTHGIDKPTRTAWVQARVSTTYPEPRDVFAVGPLAVKTAAMSLQASSDLRIDLNGKRQAETKGELRANWSLEFKGAKLVTFRDVSVKLDSGKFDFTIAPEKVELHPSLRFISDIAKTLGEKVPPCIELVRDSRGVIVGARANLSTIIERPLSLGAVKIGALVLVGGLALTLQEGFKFAIAGHISVGTKSAPIFVQINFLGGGMWLEAEARFVDGAITYLGNVGLALGSTESFNIGGVARGSYSLLLFAYAQFKSGGGGSFRAGLSITGCARILGIVNAYVLLLLEVMHGEGNAKGRGLLDVEVKVCKWYSVKVHKQVERSL